MLMKIEEPEQRYNLMYQNAGIFLKNEPDITLQFLQEEEFRAIDYSKMVPSFINTIREDKV